MTRQRKIIIYVATSADGYIARRDGIRVHYAVAQTAEKQKGAAKKGKR